MSSEARFRALADHAPVMLWLARPTGECELFNQQWLDFTGRTMAQELGVGWTEQVHAADLRACLQTFHASVAARVPFRREYRLRRHDGVFRWILDTGTPRYEHDVLVGFVGSCLDITELRDAQDLRLRELHHRVKNNLQLISSLLNLTKASLDAKGRAVLDETQARIRSIALVHQRLDQIGELTSVPMVTYIGELASNLHAALASSRIALRTTVDELALPIDLAIPCGLILNELITNALKHAFPDRAGTVEITAIQLPPNGFRITVADDGVGLPPGFEVTTSESLGFQLVTTLVDQLGGSFEIRRGLGTAFDLVVSSR